MTNADALRTVIERLEKAEGPNRILDCLIYGSLHWPAGKWETLQISDADSMGVDWRSVVFRRTTEGHAVYYDPPRYTESIDAALTLVPTTYRFQIWNDQAAVRDPLEPTGLWWWGQQRPAIAICIAALRSRQENEHGE